MPKKAKVLLMDANVLIDYQKSDLSVLGLVNKHVAEVHVLTPGRPTAKSPPPKCALGIWQLGASGVVCYGVPDVIGSNQPHDRARLFFPRGG